MKENLELVKKPEIKHELVKVGSLVTKRLDELNLKNLIATDETIQSLKKLRAELNKELKEYTDQLKFISDEVSKPLVEVKEIFKVEISEKYNSGIEILKTTINDFEMKIKDKKRENVIAYFNELCDSEKIDFVSFEQVGLDINLTVTEKKYKEQCNDFILKVVDDLKLIESEEFKAEMLVEYKRTLNASAAITSVRQRKELEAAEVLRLKAEEKKRRILMCQEFGLVWVEITSSFEYNDSIFITQDEILNLTNAEFRQKLAEISVAITDDKAKVNAQSIEQNEATKTEPSIAPAPKPKIVDEPVIVESSVTASFEVIGTRSQLKSLAEYMKTNNIQYKNI